MAFSINKISVHNTKNYSYFRVFANRETGRNGKYTEFPFKYNLENKSAGGGATKFKFVGLM